VFLQPDCRSITFTLDADNGVVFALIQKVRFLPIKVNSALGRKVTKDGLSSGVEAADGIVIVGNQKGQFFALDQATGAKNGLHNYLVQLSSSLIQSGRVITIANDGTVLRMMQHRSASGYKLPNVHLAFTWSSCTS
jgi:outer membrane protein assembly factor BamB